MPAHIKKDDIVEVIAGEHRGNRAKVLRVMPDKQRVIVEGVNMVYRHIRKSAANPQGRRIQKEAPIHISNVLPIDPKTNKPTRVRYQVERDASGRVIAKRRVAKSGAVLSELLRPSSGKAGNG